MPFRDTHSCMVEERATEILGEKQAKTKWGIITFVMARMGTKTVVRSIKIPGNIPVSVAQNLCKLQGGEFSPATPLDPKQQMLSEEYCFVKLSNENKREVLQALVKDFEIKRINFVFADTHLSEQYALSDEAFALILPGGVKDGSGKTVPRSLRKLPYKNSRGIIQAHLVSDSLHSLPKVAAPAGLKRKALTKLLRAATSIGMDVQCAENFKLSDLDFYLKQLEKVGG